MADTPEAILKKAAQVIAMGRYKKARALLDTAIPTATGPQQAELYAMRGTAASELGETLAAAADYQAALEVYEAAGAPDPLLHMHLLGLLAQEVAWAQPDLAYELYMREHALLLAHRDSVLRHPERRLAWVMVPLGLGLVEERRENHAEARRWLLEAQGRCAAARVKPSHRMAELIAEGLARLPAASG